MNFEGSVAGGVAGMLGISGDGDTVNITPVLTSGEKIATFVINAGTPKEETIDLYAPEGFSGSFNDLTDKPSINNHTLEGNMSTSDLGLFSGSYNDLSNKPTYNGNTFTGNMFSDVYSNNEQRIGTWIDGKPLYQKTINFSVIGDGTYKRYEHGIADIDIIFLDQSASFVYYGASTYPLIGYGGNPQSSQMAVLVWSGGFDYRAGVECNGATCYATLKYTKTTDSIETLLTR